MPRVSNSTLIELCNQPFEALTPSRRLSALAFKRRQINDDALADEAERILEEKPHTSITMAYYRAIEATAGTQARVRRVKAAAPASREEYMKAIGVTPVARDIDGLRTLEEWPDDIATCRPASKWAPVADTLRAHERTVFVIADGRTRSQALSLRRKLRHGAAAAFTPQDSWRFEAAPDHAADNDTWMVLASYTGGPA